MATSQEIKYAAQAIDLVITELELLKKVTIQSLSLSGDNKDKYSIGWADQCHARICTYDIEIARYNNIKVQLYEGKFEQASNT